MSTPRLFTKALLPFVKNVFAHFALVALLCNQFTLLFSATVWAADLPITVDNSTNTQVSKTSSNIDQINIAMPNSSGLSHNKFTDYNVNESGQIINNFSGKNSSEVAGGTGANAVTQTQIGGLVTANPNLANSGAARVILNEVTSANSSQLRGYTEIAGTKADLIIANPNGITCFGCGFVNTARLLMVGGSSNYDANGNLGFNLKGQDNPNLYVPLITIDGLGLDVTNNSSTEIIASSVKLLSTIYGADSNSVAIQGAEGRYDYATKTINAANNNSANPTSPVFAIDASNLSKIQAGNIYLIATKSGVGVKMEGEILASKTVNISSNGDVYYSKIAAANQIDVQSTQKIQTTDANSSLSATNLNISAAEFTNLGSAVANNISIKNGGSINNFGEIKALNLNIDKLSNDTKINNSGLIFAQNSLAINAKDLTNYNSAIIYSPLDYQITLSGTLNNSALITSGANLNVQANKITNNAEISAQNNLAITLVESLTNLGFIIATAALSLVGKSVENSNVIQSGSQINLKLDALTNNQNSTIFAATNLNFDIAQQLDNFADITAQNTIQISGAAKLNNRGNIAANSDVVLIANDLTNSGYINSLAKKLTINLSNDLQNQGNISAFSDVSISANNVNNSGNILAGNVSAVDSAILSLGNLQINTNSKFTNAGKVQTSANLAINSGSDVENFGNIKSLNSANISAQNLFNQDAATISADSDLAITTSANSQNKGLIYSLNNSSLKMENFANYGQISSVKNLTISSSKNFENYAVLYAKNTLKVESSDFFNSASIYADGAFVVAATNFVNAEEGAIFAKADIAVQSQNFTNVGDFTGLNLTINSVDFANSGKIVASKIIASGSGDFENSAILASDSDIVLSFANFKNSGLVQSKNDLTIVALNNFENTANSLIYSGRNLNITASSLDNFAQISAADSTQINAAVISNSNEIVANNSLKITATNFKNISADSVLASAQGDLKLSVADLVKNDGTIFAKSNLALGNAGSLNLLQNSGTISFADLANQNSELKLNTFNNSGSLSINGSNLTQITVAQSFTNFGQISSNKDLAISDSSSELVNSGNILSNQNLTISATKISNAGTAQIAAVNDLAIQTSDQIVNSGAILASKNLSLNSASIQNNSTIASLNNSVAIAVKSNLQNQGEISAKSAIQLSGADFANSGNVVSAGNLALDFSKDFTNSGALQSNADFTANIANSASNSGLINSLGNLNLAAKNLDNSAIIQSNKDLTFSLETLSNSGDLKSNADLSLQTSSSFSNSGKIYANLDSQIISQSTLNNSGLVYSKSDLAINSSETLNNHGTIYSEAILDLAAQEIVNNNTIFAKNKASLSSKILANSGLIQSDGDLALNLSSDFSNSANALIYSGKNLNISAASLSNFGQISASDSLDLNASFVSNSNQIIANNSLKTTATSLENIGSDAVLASINGNVDLSVSDFVKNEGTIFAKANFVLGNSGSLKSLQNSGIISFADLADQNSELKLNTLNNSGSLTINGSNLTQITVAQSFVNSGQISANKDLVISDSSSELVNSGNILSNQNLTISATKISNAGTAQIAAVNNLTIQTSDQISNSGAILASNNLSLSAGSVQNNSTIAALNGAAQIVVNSQLKNQGEISAKSAVQLSGADFENSGDVVANSDLTINFADNFNNSGALQSGENLIVTSNKILNSGLINSLNQLKLNADYLNNSAIIQSAAASDFVTKNFINSGNIQANQSFSINNSNSFENSGTIYGSADLLIKNQGWQNLENNFLNLGTIFSKGNLTISDQSNSLNNSATIYSEAAITLEANSLINAQKSGVIFANSSLTVKAQELDNAGSLQSNSLLQLQSGNIDNAGLILAQHLLSIHNSSNLNNSGTIFAADNLSLESFGFSNFGLVQSEKDITLNLSSDFSNSENALIYSGKNLNIAAAALNNFGQISAADSFELKAFAVSNSNQIVANNSLKTTATSLENIGSDSVLAAINGNLDLSVSDFVKNEGTIFAKSNLALGNAGSLNSLQNSGTISFADLANQNSELKLNQFNNSGSMSINGSNLTKITVAQSFTNSGQISANKDLAISDSSSELVNSGNILSNQNLTISATKISNAGKAQIAAVNNLAIQTSDQIANSGAILASNNLSINADSVQNNSTIAALNGAAQIAVNSQLQNQGEISAKNSIQLGGADFANSGNVVSAGSLLLNFSNNFTNSGALQSSADFTAHIANSASNSGLINSLGGLNLAAKNLDNSAIIQASKASKINLETLNNSGELQSSSDLSLQTSASFNNLGTIYAQLALQINSDSELRNDGNLYSGANLFIKTAQDVTNKGTIYSASKLEIQTNNISAKESSLIFAKDELLLEALSDISNQGTIQSESDISLKAQNLNNNGLLAAQQNLNAELVTNISNQGVIFANQGVNLEALKLDNANLIQSDGNVSLNLSSDFSNSANALIYSGKNLDISAVSLSNFGQISATDSVDLKVSAISNSNQIIANNSLKTTAISLENRDANSVLAAINGNLDLSVSDFVKNEGTIFAKSNLALGNAGSLNSLQNSGTISFADLANQNSELKLNQFNNSGSMSINGSNLTKITVAQSFTNSGQISANKDLVISDASSELVNSGNILSNQNLTISATKISNAGKAQIAALKDLNLQTNEKLDNSGSVLASNNLSINSAAIQNNSAIAALNGAAQIAVTSQLQNQGEISAKSVLQLSGADFVNSGNVVSTANLALNFTNNFTNSGALQSNSDFTANIANSASNSGLINSLGGLNLAAKNLDNSAIIQSNKDLTFNLETLSNSGDLQSSSDLSLQTSYSFTNSGKIYANSSSQITSQSSLNNFGVIYSKDNLVINSSDLLSNEGTIYSEAILNLSAQQLLNKTNAAIFANSAALNITSVENLGNIQSNSTFNLTSANVANSGVMLAQTGLLINNSNDLTNSGTIFAADKVELSSRNLTNSNLIQSDGNVVLNLSSDFSNSANALIYSGKNLNIAASSLSNLGQISAADSADLKSSSVSNSNQIIANNSLKTTATSLENIGSDAVLASINGNLDLSVSNSIKNEGTIFAKANFVLGNSGSLNLLQNSGTISFADLANQNSELKLNTLNNSGSFSINGSSLTQITVAQSFANSGQISANKDLTISDASSELVNYGNILSNQNLTISATKISNAGKAQIAAVNDLAIQTSDQISNSGSILASNNLSINANSVQNNSNIAALGGAANIVAQNIANEGEIFAKTNLNLASSAISNLGSILANNNLVISGDQINNYNTLQSSATINISANNLQNFGTVYSQSTLSLLDLVSVQNSGIIFSETNISAALNNLVNANNSVISANQNIAITSANSAVNQGAIVGGNNLSLAAQNLENSGSIQSGNNAEILVNDALTNSSTAKIYAAGDMTISGSAASNSGEILALTSLNLTAQSLTNSKTILANQNVNLTADSIDNNANSTLASTNQSLNLQVASDLKNAGTIFAKTDFKLSDGATLNNLNNSGAISFYNLANNNQEVQVNNFTNSGSISAAGSADLVLSAKNNFSNSGSLTNQGDLKINVANAVSANLGVINSSNNLVLNSHNFSNSGEISAINNLTIKDSNKLINTNKILSAGALTISAAQLENGSANNTTAAIAALGTNLNLAATGQLNNFAQLSAANNIDISAQNFTNSQDVLAGAKLTQNISNTINNSGSFQSIATTQIKSNSLINSGSIKSFAAANIESATIDNQSVATIFSAADLSLKSQNDLANSGAILSNSALTINAAKLENSGQIAANNNLTLTLSNNFTNSGNLSALGQIKINSTATINNSNQINSAGDLAIAASSLTNSKTIQSSAKIDLNLETLNNTSSIISSAAFTLNASTAVNNYANLISQDSLTINSTSLNNNSAGLIFANKDLNISVNSANNQNTKPSDSVINAGLVSANGAVKIKANSFNNNSGIVTGQSTSLSALSTSNVTLNNNSGLFISTANIVLNLGSLDYTISGEVTASSINISANNISNIGNVTASDFIKLNATGASNVANSGNITNGTSSGDNSKIALTAGSYITLTAKNNVENYATIQGSTDVSISATNGNINNYSTGKIAAGSGTLTLNSLNGALNNLAATSLITASNNAVLNVKDVVNNGEISTNSNLTINATNNISNNSSALLWSGNNMTLNVANNLTNIWADIYANNNLTIQKDSAGNKANAITNTSGNIATYAGDITINANSLTNNRAVDVVDKRPRFKNTTGWQSDWINIDNWCYGDRCSNKVNDYFTIVTANSNSVSGKISSGKNLSFSGTTFNNLLSEVSSAGNMTINANSITNSQETDLVGNVVYRINNGSGYLMNPMDGHGSNDAVSFNSGYVPAGYTTETIHNQYYRGQGGIKQLVQYMPGYSYQTFSSFIKSGGSLNITQNGTNKTSTFVNGSTVTQNASSSVKNYFDSTHSSTILNGINSYTLGETAALNVDLSAIINAINNNNSADSSSSYNLTNSSQSTQLDNVTAQNVVTDVADSNDAKVLAINSTNQDVGNVTLASASNVATNNLKSPTVNNAAAISSSSAITIQSGNQTVGNVVTVSSANISLNDVASITSDNASAISSSNVAINAASNSNNSVNIISASAVEGSVVLAPTTESVNSIFTSQNQINTTTPTELTNSQIAGGFVAAPLSQNQSAITASEVNISMSPASNNVSNNVTASNVVASDAAAPTLSTTTAATQNTSQVKQTSLNVSQNSQIVFAGNFKINLDPAATTPLVESRSQFTDVSKFFGSSYYFDQLGLKGTAVLSDLDRQTRNTNIRMLGDAFVETTLITNQLKTLTNDSLLLSQSKTDANAQVKELLDNSVAELTRLGLNAQDVALHGLTSDQANLLTKDIVTFELTSVKGVQVLAPKIYLSLDTRNRLLGSSGSLSANSTIFAKDDLTIDASATSLINSGSIVAGNNLTLNVGSLTSDVAGFNSLSTTLVNNLAQIKAGNDLTITANNSSNNFAAATVNSAASSANSGINLNNTLLQAGGFTTLNSFSDVTIANDASLQLASFSDSIASMSTLRSSSLFSASAFSSFSASSIKDDAASQRASLTFNSANDIQINSAGSINISNNYTNTGGSIFMTAVNNINNSNFQISASDNVVMEANNINNIHTVANNFGNETKIEAGNIVSLNAIKDADGKGGNITNIGATISGGSLVYLTADNNITNKALIEYNINGNKSYSSGLTSNQTAADFTDTTLDSSGVSTSDTNVQNSNANYIRSNLIEQGNITSGGNLVLVAGNNINNIGSNITADGSTYLEATNGNINITTAVLRDRTVTRWGGRKKGGVSISDNTTNLESSIISGNSGSGTLELVAKSDLTTGSSTAGNINIKGSSLTTADSLTLTAANDVNIKSVQDTTFSFSAGKTGRGKSYLKQSSSTTQIGSELSTTNNGDIKISSGYNNTDIVGSDNAFGNINIIASKLVTKDADSDLSNNVGSGDINLTARNEVNILSALNTFDSKVLSGSKGYSVKKSSTDIKNTTTNVQSEISSNNDLIITSGSDTNITASSLSGNGSANITAGKYLDLNSASSTYNTEIYNPDAKVNILNGFDTSYSMSQTTKTSNTFGPKNIAIATVAVGGAAFTGGASLYLVAAAAEFGGSKTTAGKYSETAVKSNLTFGENINIASASDLNITASKLSAGTDVNSGEASGKQGDVNLVAGKITTANFNDSTITTNTNTNAAVNITSNAENSYSYNITEKIGLGGRNIKFNQNKITYGQYDRIKSTDLTSTQVSSEIASNNGNITIAAQKDLNIVASDITNSLSDDNSSNTILGKINLISDSGNVNILSSYNTKTSSLETLHGDLNANFNLDSHELAFRAGVEGNGQSVDTTNGTVIASNILGSSVNITSGISSDYGSGISDPTANSSTGNINVDSSNILANRDSVDLTSANDINLFTSSNYFTQTTSDFDFSAYVRLGGSYNFKDTWKSIEDLKDVDLKNAAKYLAVSSVAGYAGAGGATPYVATYGPLIASMMDGDSMDESLAKNSDYINDANTINNAGKGGSGSAGLTVELAYSQDKSRYNQHDVVMNNIVSASDISLISNNSDINIHSTNLTADQDINLMARKGDINIVADTSNSSSSSKSLDLSGSIAIIGKGGSLNIGYSSTKSSSEDYINSVLNAGGAFNLNSGGDTNIISSNVLASDVNMVVAGDLNLESKQNTSNSKGYSFGIGGGFYKTGGGKSGSGNLSYLRSFSDRDWVDNQASILGTDSVMINVGDNTNLVGSVIANSTNGQIGNNAIDGGNLTLNTNTLTFSNLYDSDTARSFGIGLAGSARSGGSSGGGIKGSASLTLDYLMHDYKQTTNAVVGSGNINTGATLNLDSNNDLTSVIGGTTNDNILLAGLNRDVTQSQIITKSLTVDPIHIKETFEFGRNSTESQQSASSNGGSGSSSSSSSSERPTIWQDLAKDRSGQSATQATGSFLSDVGSGLFSNLTITLSNLATQINPLRGFSNSLDGISTDLRNMRSDLGIETQTLNVGQDRKFVTINQDGTKQEFTLAQYLQDPTLAATKLFSNGIMNNFSDSERNAKSQVGYDENGRITILFDPTAAPDGKFRDDRKGNTIGFLSDIGEVLVNYAGANILGGAIQTKGQATDEKFITAVTNNAKENGTEVTLAGHSGGGLRNYLALANSTQGQYLDSNGNSVLKVQFSGTPVNNFDLVNVSTNAGVGEVQKQNNPGDTVGNVLGANGDILQGALSAYSFWKLFGSSSPHSNYGCILSNCNSSQITTPVLKLNSQ